MIDYQTRLLKRLWPLCFQCKNPVLRFSYYTDIRTNSPVFEAECHGMRQVVLVDKYDMESILAGNNEINSVAFQNEQRKLGND